MPEKKKRKPSLLKPGASSSYRPTKSPLGEALFERVVTFVNSQIKSGPDDKNALLTKGLHCLMIKHTGTTKEKLKVMDIDLDDLLSYLSSSGLTIGAQNNKIEVTASQSTENLSIDNNQIEVVNNTNQSNTQVKGVDEVTQGMKREIKRKRF